MENLWKTFLSLQINLNESQKTALQVHFEILKEWNKIHNLTAIHNKEDIFKFHYLDSFLGLKALNTEEVPNTIYDLGSGAGFPGLMAAIWWPEKEIVVVESSKKKESFLKIACHEMKLNRTKVLGQRAESLRGIKFALSRAAFSRDNWKILRNSFATTGKMAFWLSDNESVQNSGWVLEKQHYYELEPGHRRQVAVFHVEPTERENN